MSGVSERSLARAPLWVIRVRPRRGGPATSAERDQGHGPRWALALPRQARRSWTTATLGSGSRAMLMASCGMMADRDTPGGRPDSGQPQPGRGDAAIGAPAWAPSRALGARWLQMGKSQEELARDSSLHWSYLGQVERGSATSPCTTS